MNNSEIQPTRWSDLSYKERVMYVICIGAFILGFALTIAGFVVPPTGQISPSVLTYFGSTLAFVASLLGVSQHYDTELLKFKSKVEQELKER